MRDLLQIARSLVYYSAATLSVPLWALALVICLPLPYHLRYAVLLSWIRLQHFMLRTICGLRFEVRGLENLPDRPAVVFAKHQSVLETITTQLFLPPQTWVVKREVLAWPIFGWGLRAAAPIAIDRRAGRAAVEQVVRQGRARLADGIWVIIFPEGTRVRPGETRGYGAGGATLAARSGAPVMPLAHNAGEFWVRGRLLIRAGTVQFRVGPPVDPAGLTPREINRRVQEWIEAEMDTLEDQRGGSREQEAAPAG